MQIYYKFPTPKNFYNKISKKLLDRNLKGDENILVLVSRGSMSKAVGQNKRNKLRLNERYKNLSFSEADGISDYEILLEINNGEIKCI